MFFRILDHSVEQDNGKLWTYLQRAFVGLSALFIFIFIKGNSGGTAGAEFLIIHFRFVYFLAGIICIISFSGVVQDFRKDETLSLVLMTGVSIPKLLLSIFFSKLTQLLILLAVQLPFSLYAVTLGGVTVEMVTAIFISTGIWLVLMASLGALFSGMYSKQNESIIAGSVVFLILFLILDILNLSPMQVLEEVIVTGNGAHFYYREVIWAVLSILFLVVLLLKFQHFYFNPKSFLESQVDDYINKTHTNRSGVLKNLKANENGRMTVRFEEEPIYTKDLFLNPWDDHTNLYEILGSGKISKWLFIPLIFGPIFYLQFKYGLSNLFIHIHLLIFALFIFWLKIYKAIKPELDEQTMDLLLVLPCGHKEVFNQKLKFIRSRQTGGVWGRVAFIAIGLFIWTIFRDKLNWAVPLSILAFPILKSSVEYLILFITFIDPDSPGLSSASISLFLTLAFFMFPLVAIPLLGIFYFYAEKLILKSIQNYAESC